MVVEIIPKSAKKLSPSAPEKSAKNGQKGWPKGTSGNLSGRPKGSRNKISLLVQQLIDENAEEIIGKLIELAKGGEFPALKFLAERYVPPMRSHPIRIYLPSIKTPAEILKAYDQIWHAVGAGEITLDEMERLKSFLESKQKGIESIELAARIEELEIVAGLES